VGKIAVSKFKATCLAILERVRKTGESYVITKRGVPIAQVVLPRLLTPINKSAFGCMAEMGEEIGDIVEPISDVEWEALRLS
jgi:prevent-host-death family protein